MKSGEDRRFKMCVSGKMGYKMRRKAQAGAEDMCKKDRECIRDTKEETDKGRKIEIGKDEAE